MRGKDIANSCRLGSQHTLDILLMCTYIYVLWAATSQASRQPGRRRLCFPVLDRPVRERRGATPVHSHPNATSSTTQLNTAL
ncbi:hypothetical protein E2C01_032959 [Portunus trituberculatus]|uniref:Uncharacterized protein n=1 Tax=Portunus trituberculatus TaxID=210409 RepID=A0A5B7F2W7_PORTR|nr:hypothetical protein [Portunus trituberculatus]